MTKAENKNICIQKMQTNTGKAFAAYIIVKGRFEFLNNKCLLYLAVDIRATFC